MNEVKGAVELQNFTEPPKIYIDDTTTEEDIQKIELNENELLYRNGFKNSKETLKPVEVNANGNLPSWLNGDFYTVGPGTWFDGLPLVNRFDIDGENNKVVELDANDLIPERVYSWDEINANFKGDHAAPHSYYDEQTGELINFNMEYHALGTKYNFFSITSSNPNDYFAFNPEEPTLFHLISRTKKQHILTYKSDACFAFHHINAFEDDEDNIFVDMSCYDNADIAHYLTIENLSGGLVRGLPLSEVRRFALQNIQIESVKFAKNPQSSSFEVIQNTVSAFLWSTNSNQQVYYPWPVANYVRCADSTLELPTINPKYKGNRYRYVYGIGLSAKAAGQEGQIWDSIVKSDLDTKEVVAMWGTENCYPSEPIFVPEPGEDHEEDDGVLLSVIFDGLKISSFLIVLEAKTLTELARVNLPQVIPLSFGHGAFKAKEN
ncbi:2209_t:CDS:2 [Entrophospora sp. SA101]|nr:2209_t:CDS:2 [Entrophospora sp. SA101]